MIHPSQAKGLIIDMDGVLWRGPDYLPGIKPFFEQQRRSDRKLMLVTNNATAIAESVIDRLAGLGVHIDRQEVLTSSVATAHFLKEQFPSGTIVFPIGEDALRQALVDSGFSLSENADRVGVVVVGFDREINWHKMTQAALAIENGALFVGTNPDPSFPIPQGLAPGNGAFVAALQVTTGVDPVIIGKPEPLLYLQAADSMQVAPADILAIGDRLGTDIVGAKRAGMASALLLTGVTSADEAASSEIRADWVYADLTALAAALEHG